MAVELIEDGISAVLTWLRENLPAEVAAVNARHAGDGLGIVIAAPEEHSYSTEEWDNQVLPPLPAIGVLGDTSRLISDSNGYLRTGHDIMVVVVDGDADKNLLRRKLYRHVEAIVHCLLASSLADSGFTFYWPEDGVYARYDAIAIIDETYFTDGQVYLTVQTEGTHGS